MTYTYCKKIIQNGDYEKDDMMNKLDVFLLNDRINQPQYEELISIME